MEVELLNQVEEEAEVARVKQEVQMAMGLVEMEFKSLLPE